jgi:hypothetical protein
MNEKKETLIRELHERLMTKFMDRIGESIGGIQMVADTKADDDRTKGADPDPQGQELDSPDMINVIRHKVTDAEDLVILDPDKQKELLEILKQGYEEFQHLLRGIVSEDNSRSKLATQKFKDELMANTQRQLAEKRHTFAD